MEKNGYKTKQRDIILQVLIENKARHMTVDELIDCLREKNAAVGKSTIYRYLDKLVEAGQVRRFFVEEGMSACYQFNDHGNACITHYHLKCVCCGKLFHVECEFLDGLKKHIFDQHHFTVDNSKTVLYGCCEHCSQR